MKQQNTKTTVLLFSALSIVVIWLALVTASCYEDGVKLFDLLGRLAEALNQPLNISINQYSLKFVLLFLFAYAMGIGIYFTSRENRRPGEEHGSAKWGNASALARKYADRKHKFRNIILSQTLALSLNAKAHRRNLNVLIVGGSGAGKTRFYAKPNIMQCNTSLVIADPKGGATRFCTNTIL